MGIGQSFHGSKIPMSVGQVCVGMAEISAGIPGGFRAHFWGVGLLFGPIACRGGGWPFGFVGPSELVFRALGLLGPVEAEGYWAGLRGFGAY